MLRTLAPPCPVVIHFGDNLCFHCLSYNVVFFSAKVLAGIAKDQSTEEQRRKCYEHEGVFLLESSVTKATLQQMPGWKARPDDVFIVTYPKAGW